MNQTDEWLEADGWGGFASGTTSGIRTRRYHALLLVARTPPTGRYVLVNGFDAWVETEQGTFPLSTQQYASGVIHPDARPELERFDANPFPRWRYRLPDATCVELELFVPHGPSANASTTLTALCWRRLEGTGPVTLIVRPLMSGRDYHALHHENPAFRFDPTLQAGRVSWHPYNDVPATVALFNGQYEHQPVWYRDFLYLAEHERGLDCVEDLASPGLFRWNLADADAVWMLMPSEAITLPVAVDQGVEELYTQLRTTELERRIAFTSPLHRAADAYIVRRDNQHQPPSGKTILAGYPWFTDWGRDTFIALRGLCLATGRFDDARAILSAWSAEVVDGMLPNRFPDHGDEPEFNSVDASLWFVVAADDYFTACAASGHVVEPAVRQQLVRAVEQILEGYSAGTRYGIRLDDDGLIAAGEAGVQLTWMDAKVADWVVTPRIGKPVEIEALWLNALWIGGQFSDKWKPLLERGRESFRARFWNGNAGCLYDVIDCDHRAGSCDAAFRPNQIFAVGGLPLQLLAAEQSRQIVDAVEAQLWTPLGLRSLAPDDPSYHGRYTGDVRERDGAYHQGTVWAWLLGPFVEGWVRVRGNTIEARREARTRFLDPLLVHLDEAGVGHLSEIADGAAPHTPRGCPFQAWSVGEALRLSLDVLADDTADQVSGSIVR